MPEIVAVGAATISPCTVTVTGKLSVLPSAKAVTVKTSSRETVGTVAVHSPSSFAATVTVSPLGSSTVTSAPGSAVPLTVVAPATTGATVGAAVWSSALSSGTTIVVAGLRYS